MNAAVSKKGSLAYDTSKAAANHLVRELAIELAPLVRVNGLAPATVVQGSTMFPKDRVVSSLKKYGIAFDPDASADALRRQLADFYAQRTLTRQPITPEDQAEAPTGSCRPAGSSAGVTDSSAVVLIGVWVPESSILRGLASSATGMVMVRTPSVKSASIRDASRLSPRNSCRLKRP